MQVTTRRIQAWIDEKPIANVEIGGRTIGLRYGEIKLSAPLGFASYGTTGAHAKNRDEEIGPRMNANARECKKPCVLPCSFVAKALPVQRPTGRYVLFR